MSADITEARPGHELRKPFERREPVSREQTYPREPERACEVSRDTEVSDADHEHRSLILILAIEGTADLCQCQIPGLGADPEKIGAILTLIGIEAKALLQPA